MPDPEFNHARPATTPGPFPRVGCPKCGADLSLLPKVARFCNRCGAALAEGAFAGLAAAPSAPSEKPTGPWFCRPRWLFNLWFACVDCDTGITRSASAGRSAVLLAYGKSLFNLGWRYEHAVGARRNLSEAARCYWKAARLGDPSAVGRLNPHQASVYAPARPAPAPCPVP